MAQYRIVMRELKEYHVEYVVEAETLEEAVELTTEESAPIVARTKVEGEMDAFVGVHRATEDGVEIEVPAEYQRFAEKNRNELLQLLLRHSLQNDNEGLMGEGYRQCAICSEFAGPDEELQHLEGCPIPKMEDMLDARPDVLDRVAEVIEMTAIFSGADVVEHLLELAPLVELAIGRKLELEAQG